MIKYLGSKRTLIPDVLRVVEAFPGLTSVVDLFSGTSRVGHALKRAGYRVYANDHNAYASTLARCYVEADRDRVELDARRLLEELGRVPGRSGYFTQTFCIESRFFQPKNGERIDAIREAIAAKGLDPVLESVLLVSLMEAADRVDSTCGLQMAYLKKWAPRSHHELELRLPDVLPAVSHGPCRAHMLDALEAARTLEADVAYLDPPYNQHSYLSNYHVWETLVRWDRPEHYGIACKRTDCRERKSVFNTRRAHLEALREVVRALRTKAIVLSFSNEGFLTREEVVGALGERGEVFVLDRDFKRYVGAQIGIHNPRGVRVGRVSHLRNTESIFVVSTEADRLPAKLLTERLGAVAA